MFQSAHEFLLDHSCPPDAKESHWLFKGTFLLGIPVCASPKWRGRPYISTHSSPHSAVGCIDCWSLLWPYPTLSLAQISGAALPRSARFGRSRPLTCADHIHDRIPAHADDRHPVRARTPPEKGVNKIRGSEKVAPDLRMLCLSNVSTARGGRVDLSPDERLLSAEDDGNVSSVEVRDCGESNRSEEQSLGTMSCTMNGDLRPGRPTDPVGFCGRCPLA